MLKPLRLIKRDRVLRHNSIYQPVVGAVNDQGVLVEECEIGRAEGGLPFNDNGIPPRLASLLAREPEVKMSQFRLGSAPFWAWVCAVLDPQDAIKRRFN